MAGAQFRPLTLTLLLAAFLLLPSIASIGMFLDGLIYASVSRNLAAGIGSAWAPSFSAGLFPLFHEHPPLVFWLQSLAFRLLGDSYLTERVYDLAVLAVSVLLLRALWRQAVRAAGRPGLAGYWWLALLCWVLVPKWSWAFRNNVLESTMTLWCLLAVLLAFAASGTANPVRTVFLAVLAAVATAAAFLSKGLPALFVLPAAVLLLPLKSDASVSRALVVAALQTGFFVLFVAGMLALIPDARALLALWWADQVVARTGFGGGWMIVPELAKKLAPMALVAIGSVLILRRRLPARWWRPTVRPAISIALLGLAASLPLVLGDRDSGHYLLPSLPFFALAFGLPTAAALDAGGRHSREALARRPDTAFLLVTVVLASAIIAFSASRLGEVRKNERYHALFDQVVQVTGPGVVIAIDPALYEDWMLHAVAQRYHRIGLDPDARASWRLAPRNALPETGNAVIASGDWVLLGTP